MYAQETLAELPLIRLIIPQYKPQTNTNKQTLVIRQTLLKVLEHSRSMDETVHTYLQCYQISTPWQYLQDKGVMNIIINSGSPWVLVSAAIVEVNFLEGGRDKAETEDGRLAGQNWTT